MKNRLLPLIFVLSGFAAYSQVGIGTPMPNASAQLEIVSSEKGMLIPRVPLKSTTDKTTIKNSNVNSLLVFNTATVSDVTPGYYYWYNDKWSRMAISTEVAGFMGAPGAPGNKGEAGYPGKDITIYTDTSTNLVYVQNADGTWILLNGKNGLDGKNGIIGGNGVPGAPGTPGIDGTIQMYVDYSTGIVYVRDPEDNTKWVSLNGTNGLDGKNGIIGGNGVPGAPGTPGIDGTIQMYVDYSTGIVYVRDPEDNTKWVSLNGTNGLDGKNGIIGGNGVPGASGTPGIDGTIQMYVDYSTGIVYVRDPEDNTKWVSLNGKNGNNGKDGISGGNGVPGVPGTPAIDDVIQMYVDYNTNIIYVRDPNDPTKWIPTGKKDTLTSLRNEVKQETDNTGQVVNVYSLVYKDEDGVDTTVDISTLVKDTETLTSLTYDGGLQELNYKDEKGDVTTFKLVDLIGPAQTLTKLEVNNTDGTLDYTDENKVLHPLNLADVVKEPWYNVADNKGATLNTDNLYTQGWVGIGFDKPSTAVNEKLRVNGAITTVNSYYADYVFEDYFEGFSAIKADYKFKKLEDVDAFIKKNKHLPGITPINELVKTKEGYSFNVSELSIQLLEKTEELYLHVIEQENEIQAKNSLISELQKKTDEILSQNEAQNELLKAKNLEIQTLKALTQEINSRLKALEKLVLDK